jgi:DNA topoisomerase I
MKGRYGPYVKWDKVNATLPKDMAPEDITLEQAIELVNAKAATKGKPKKPAAKKPAAKKPAAKKPAAKKSRPSKASKITCEDRPEVDFAATAASLISQPT